jgi:hypothetical protein
MASMLLMASGLRASAPAAPERGVRDDARILSDADRADLERELMALREGTGLTVMIDTATFLPPETSPALWVRRLRDAWLEDAPGAVVFLSRRGGGPPIVDASASLWTRLGDPHVYAMLQRVTKVGSASTSLDVNLLSSVRSLIADLHAADTRSRQTHPLYSAADFWLAMGLAAALLLAAALSTLMVRSERKRAAARASVKVLPDVIMPTRLGASRGATVVERSYRK